MGLFSKNRNSLEKEQLQGAPLITYYEPKSVISEQFRTVRTNIQFARLDTKLKSILVTSSIPGEGKSMVAANLANVMAQNGQNVLLVDSDLRKPTVHRTFALDNSQGLSTLLSDREADINQIIHRLPELGLSILSSGPVPPNPAELLNSARMTSLMSALEQYFDVIIYDVSPLTAVTDAQIMAAKVDGVVFVMRQDYVLEGEVRHAVETLNNVNANILGCITNGVDASSASEYYAYAYGEDL
ncbi:CpsD/CapB family tyrosine-protein kinase [Hutsoniella sourekii]|uniref:CpsD/CapB family tyrosine-protein kinase n=1 Tax=Hutsoniella sourekii TaxID=87650 RepID=UPI0004832510|nr:CpsD/CapB family tyrosine-protein kinase [Hutsoniella sourekii]